VQDEVHLVQKLQDKGVQNAQIIQISGHKNVASINSYSRLNQNQQKHILKVIGLPIFTRTDCLYFETGWEPLQSRRHRRKLQLFYKI
jgi:hypothetical protein